MGVLAICALLLMGCEEDILPDDSDSEDSTKTGVYEQDGDTVTVTDTTIST